MWKIDPPNDPKGPGAMPRFVVQWRNERGYLKHRSFLTSQQAEAFMVPAGATDVEYLKSAVFPVEMF